MHMTTEEKNVIAMNELDLVKNAIYTDPEDQSAWLYYWWLLGRAPDYVECMGAYSLESKPTAIYLGFNDMIKFIEPPTVLDEQSNRVPSRLYPLCSKNGESASTWMLAVDVANAKTISLQSNAILPSTSAKSISQKTWQVEIKKMMQGSVIQERVALVKSREWQPVSIKMYKDPILEDQSAWFALDKVQLLKDEIETVRELLEIEPDSAWAMQTLVHFLSQMQLRSQIDKESIYAEIADILDKLMDIDKDRRFRYQDQKNKLLFDQATQGPLKDESIATYNEILDLDQVEGHVPLLSKLLFL
ncbi:uncharacterized protein B0P05DRAFT_541630 [Gilbertella persicaria]|uniref:uncharacterized protein n=1 Tax=Gilbertella persicaria TaxID=101096 RepID=UPI00221F2319|nr:uncharacterized protein B0P05DRAFT_541630 [Gilbertella persicaria]KAI8079694.1 hypothetical protein B0P05DRAFT_541630 [Gilbertella persicaria]